MAFFHVVNGRFIELVIYAEALGVIYRVLPLL